MTNYLNATSESKAFKDFTVAFDNVKEAFAAVEEKTALKSWIDLKVEGRKGDSTTYPKRDQDQILEH